MSSHIKTKFKAFLKSGINKYRFVLSMPKIKKYKNKYKGQRCFIIGNGPSLKVSDLEKLKSEITFVSHGIYYIYDQTDWRPTFYCAQDAKFINQRSSLIKANCKNVNFFGLVQNWYYPNLMNNSIKIKLINDDFSNGYPVFSDNPLNGLYEGLTVTYFILQLATYMGFNEMYLLGVDHFYAGGENDHFSKEDICTNIPETDKSTLAYQSAKMYAEHHNIKIYNATRGGHLEVFERVNFDDVLKEIK